MTASTLYEAVEPEIIWQQLLAAVFLEITGDGAQFEVWVTLFPGVITSLTFVKAIKMVSFILETFSQDEEIQTIHLPIAFSAIVDVLNVRRIFDAFILIYFLPDIILVPCSEQYRGETDYSFSVYPRSTLVRRSYTSAHPACGTDAAPGTDGRHPSCEYIPEALLICMLFLWYNTHRQRTYAAGHVFRCSTFCGCFPELCSPQCEMCPQFNGSIWKWRCTLA